jgi:hypothetical protein
MQLKLERLFSKILYIAFYFEDNLDQIFLRMEVCVALLSLYKSKPRSFFLTGSKCQILVAIDIRTKYIYLK